MTKPLCYHHEKRLVWTHLTADCELIAGGGKQLRYQCLGCGKLIAGAVAQSHARPSTPPVDVDRLKEWKAYDRRQWSAYREEVEVRKIEAITERRERYLAYLRTDQWQERRRLVLTRADGICEGCGVNAATQAHHLTYEHLGNEFLWELKAVCESCHERVHDL